MLENRHYNLHQQTGMVEIKRGKCYYFIFLKMQFKKVSEKLYKISQQFKNSLHVSSYLCDISKT